MGNSQLQISYLIKRESPLQDFENVTGKVTSVCCRDLRRFDCHENDHFRDISLAGYPCQEFAYGSVIFAGWQFVQDGLFQPLWYRVGFQFEFFSPRDLGEPYWFTA